MARDLICHPDAPGPDIRIAVATRWMDESRDLFVFRYEVSGDIAAIAWPPTSRKPPTRGDGLWQATCFEAFVRAGEQSAYREFNFSPSTDWAAYDFDDYRQGMRAARVGRVIVARMPFDEMMVFEGICAASDLKGATHMNLSAVIEETDGTKSYWALAHPPGKPDFHHPDCFALELPAPERA